MKHIATLKSSRAITRFFDLNGRVFITHSPKNSGDTRYHEYTVSLPGFRDYSILAGFGGRVVDKVEAFYGL